jgi:hypothetical protein
MPEPNSLGPPWTVGFPDVVDCRELFRGRSRQANLEGNPTYSRVFLVRVNTVKPNMQHVAGAPGIDWRAAYPDDANAYLVESSTQQDGDSPFHYKVSYTYKYLDETEKIPWRRPYVYSFSGSLASAPAFWHYSGSGSDNNTRAIIVNSASDPLSGLARDEGTFAVTIQYNQKPPFDYAKAQEYVGAINSDTWSGGGPKTWKVQSITASRKFETISGQNPNEDPPIKVVYYDTTINLAYKSTGWDLMTWDVGFNEIVGGARRKILVGSEPASEPMALSNGVQKPPGQPPDMLTFRIYPVKAFAGTFKEIPSDAFSGYPYTIPQL